MFVFGSSIGPSFWGVNDLNWRLNAGAHGGFLYLLILVMSMFVLFLLEVFVSFGIVLFFCFHLFNSFVCGGGGVVNLGVWGEGLACRV